MVKSHSLLELTQSIESVIQRTYHASYWVSAEISKLNYYPKSGHCYPELVEKKNDKIVAEIRSTIWNSTYFIISQKFQQQTGETLKEGMRVLFQVQVKYSPTHGISLNVLDVEPSFTLGEMALEKKNTVSRLKKEGRYTSNKLLALTKFPNRLAIISVSTSKGYHDFLQTMEGKAARFNYSINLFPAILQGDNAIKSISGQLEEIYKQADQFDAILVIRGGGGDVGMHCYNNYDLSNVMSHSPIPVITGIGHSTNETVMEMIAHTNKITPTAVADYLVDIYRDLEAELEGLTAFFTQDIPFHLAEERKRMIQTLTALKNNSTLPLIQQQNKLRLLNNQLLNSTKGLITEQQTLLNLKYTARIASLAQNVFQAKKAHLEQLETKTNLLDPKSVLKRGFSHITHNGKSVTSISDLKIGDEIKTQLFDGELESTISKKTENE